MSTQPLDSFDDPTPNIRGRLQGKIAIVTGASSGFGRAISFRFSKEGAKIVCADIRADVNFGGSRAEDAGYRTDEYINKKGGSAYYVQTDVSKSEAIQNLVSQAVEKYGRLDIMVNNAGVCMEATSTNMNKLIHETDESVFDRTVAINARSVFLGCKYACQQFLKQDTSASGNRGWIVNIGSTASLIAHSPCQVSYCASKGAVLQITRAVATDMAPFKVHCNILCPGDVLTACYPPHLNDEKVAAESVSNYPWGRFGYVKEIAGAAFFLASEDAGYVTGAILSADGGYTALG